MTIPGKDARLTPYGSTNLGMDLSLIDSLIVPNDRFFVRSNGPTPQISAAHWTMDVDGAVAHPFTIDFAELVHLPSRTLTALLECTGNGRTRFSPPAEGTPWLNDAAGNAVWRGVPVSLLLDHAEPLPEALEVVSQGADLASMRRGLPLYVAAEPDVLLVYEMNGEPLPAAHGGPVRLLVPGWAGVASTKWLTRLEVWSTPFTGEYQGELYVVYDEDGTAVAPITQMPVKSVIQSPVDAAEIVTGRTTISGYAWSGYAGIARVDVRIGDGDWQPAEIVEEAGPRSWSRWVAEVELEPGTMTIAARATDERGFQQPRTARWNQKGYMMNAIQTVTVEVTR